MHSVHSYAQYAHACAVWACCLNYLSGCVTTRTALEQEGSGGGNRISNEGATKDLYLYMDWLWPWMLVRWSINCLWSLAINAIDKSIGAHDALYSFLELMRMDVATNNSLQTRTKNR